MEPSPSSPSQKDVLHPASSTAFPPTSDTLTARILSEFLTSERQYLENLKCLFEVLSVRPNSSGLVHEFRLSRDIRGKIASMNVSLSHLRPIIGLSEQLLSEIGASTAEEDSDAIGIDGTSAVRFVIQTLNFFSSAFRLYVGYVEIYDLIVRELDGVQESTSSDDAVGTSSQISKLQSLLILPIQRIMRYSLFVRRIEEVCEIEDVSVRLSEVLERFEAVCKWLEQKRWRESMRREMMRLVVEQKEICVENFIQPWRRLIKLNESRQLMCVDQTKPKRIWRACRLYLFTDLIVLLISKTLRKKTIVWPLRGLKCSIDSRERPPIRGVSAFVILSREPTTTTPVSEFRLIVGFSDSEMLEAWHHAITDQVKKMESPRTRIEDVPLRASHRSFELFSSPPPPPLDTHAPPSTSRVHRGRSGGFLSSLSVSRDEFEFAVPSLKNGEQLGPVNDGK